MKIAVIGATGVVGESLCNIIANKLPKAQLQLYGNKSVGTKVCYGRKRYTIMHTRNIWDNLPDVAMLMANEDVAKELVPQLAQKGVKATVGLAKIPLAPVAGIMKHGFAAGKAKFTDWAADRRDSRRKAAVADATDVVTKP